MGYQTLYRKYRPQTFSEVVGQQYVAKVLRNSVQRERIGHAYLFSGPRGTGKTSVARIFAKALNCDQVKDGEPCGTCPVCTSIAAGNAPDVIEIDAASNRGIDDIRDLREKVHYAPARFKYKVYIIDEAHMITPQGFNALLKTLEEPPAHAVFILCTTEPHKLPLTILSRLLKLEFHRLPLQPLATHALAIARQEGADLTKEAALELAKLSEGSMRDTISLLEQAMAFESKTIDEQGISELFHLTSPEQITALALALVRSRKNEIAQIAEELILSGRDPERMLLEVAGELEKFLLSRGHMRRVFETRGLPYRDVPDEQLVAAVSECWEASSHLRREANPSLLFKITLYRIAHVLGQARKEPTESEEPEGSARPPAPQKATSELPVAGTSFPPKSPDEPSPPEPAAKGDSGRTRSFSPASADELPPEEVAVGPPVAEPEGITPRTSAPAGTTPLFGESGKQAEMSAPADEMSLPPQDEHGKTQTHADTADERTIGSGRPEFRATAPADSRWQALLDSIRDQSITTFCLLFEGPQPEVKQQRLVLHYPHRLRFFSQLLRQPSNLRLLKHFVARHYGSDWTVEILSEAPGAEAAQAEQVARDVLDLFPGSREIELGQ